MAISCRAAKLSSKGDLGVMAPSARREALPGTLPSGTCRPGVAPAIFFFCRHLTIKCGMCRVRQTANSAERPLILVRCGEASQDTRQGWWGCGRSIKMNHASTSCHVSGLACLGQTMTPDCLNSHNVHHKPVQQRVSRLQQRGDAAASLS